MKRIKNPYLMWIGTEHYPTFEDYAEEAKAQGVSKRLPSAAMGQALLEEGSVVFVAHDEGEKESCGDCIKLIPCPECRPRRIKIKAMKKEIAKFKERYADDEDFEANAGGFLKRSVKVRQKHIDTAREEMDECEICAGHGKVRTGSGGHVVLRNGKKWDYRKYNYWLHQPKKFKPEKHVKSTHMCESCGGLGTLPLGSIRGMFIPDEIEYILKGDEGDKELEKVEAFKHISSAVVRKERPRKCGVRKAGGVYAVTTGKTKKLTKRVIKDLVDAGLIEPSEVEIHGSFVVFHRTIKLEGTKRFRGIKRWALDPEAEDQAQMVFDAME